MRKYFKENVRLLIFLLALVFLSGPFFSFVLSSMSKYLNFDLGDWLSFYGTVSGIVISLLAIHFQLSIEKVKELKKYRPEIILNNDYQLIKPNCKIYFNDKYWYHLVKNHQQNKFVESNDFESIYCSSNKRDKALAIEILNNQPIYNLHIFFGDDMDCDIIPKLNANQRIYVISRAHQREIYSHLFDKKSDFRHVPRQIKIYYTTLAGEVNEYIYDVDSKGYCNMAKKYYGVKYPTLPKGSRLCDYFFSNITENI